MNYADKNEFRFAVKEYLNSLYIGSLRSYGRFVGVQNPTEKKKGELLNDILSVLIGEIPPVEPSNRGAPVKNDFVDPKIIQKIEELKKTYLPDGLREEASFFTFKEDEKNYLILNDSGEEYPTLQDRFNKKMYVGQIATVDGVSQILSLNGEEGYQKIIVSVELIRKNDLREGDTIACYAESRPPVLYATEVLSRNGFSIDGKPRKNFEELPVAYPTEKIKFLSEKEKSIVGKYFEWILPIGKGRRGLVVAPPKAGKTFLLKNLTREAKLANSNLCVYALLLDQSPEIIAEYADFLDEENILSTSYEDEAERHVFLANFLLNRSKRLAESGKDVLLVVDSFTALMRAYNETEESAGGKTFSCGLESKTLRYIKKYLGAARSFEKGGSLTILGGLSEQTGNPADDFAYSEFLPVANFSLRLSGELSARRIFPALDFLGSDTEQPERLLNETERECEYLIRNSYLTKKNCVDLLLLLNTCANVEELLQKLKETVSF